MTSTKDNSELKTIQEKISSFAISLTSLSTKIERIPEIIDEVDVLETQIRAEEVRNSTQNERIVALETYRGTSERRMQDLEKWKWLAIGGGFVVAFLFTAIIGLIVKGYNISLVSK